MMQPATKRTPFFVRNPFPKGFLIIFLKLLYR